MAIEGIGEAVTGNGQVSRAPHGSALSGGQGDLPMIARAVEPEAGEKAGEHEDSCLNCGAAMAGPYCHQCGQKGHIHRSLRGFGHDLVHGVFHFEGKIWRTLPMLALKPGELTRRYIHGERASFVSPIALFLFSVFLMFAVFSTVGGPFSWEVDSTTMAQARADMARELAERGARIERLEAQRATLAASGRPTAPVDAELADLRRDQEMVGKALEVQTNISREGFTKGGAIAFDRMNFDTGWPKLDAAMTKGAENPTLLAYKVQTSAYKYSWALIPISVPFLWLLFLWRRGYRLYDHTVFVTYSIAFMTLLVVVLSLLRWAIGIDIVSGQALIFVPPVHMFLQLKGAYDLSPLSALWRTFFLVIFALMAGMIFFLLLVAMGVLG